MRGGGGGLRHLMYGQRLAVLAVFARGVLALLLAACWGAPANASVFWGGGGVARAKTMRGDQVLEDWIGPS